MRVAREPTIQSPDDNFIRLITAKRRNTLDGNDNNMDAEFRRIWSALANLDKADVQTTALCHAIITLLVDNNIVTQEQAAEELGKSIPKVMALRKGISDAIFGPSAIFNTGVENETVQ
jgi:hypothetical protein